MSINTVFLRCGGWRSTVAFTVARTVFTVEFYRNGGESMGR